MPGRADKIENAFDILVREYKPTRKQLASIPDDDLMLIFFLGNRRDGWWRKPWGIELIQRGYNMPKIRREIAQKVREHYLPSPEYRLTPEGIKETLTEIGA